MGLSRRVLGRKLQSIPTSARMPVCPPFPLPSIHLASSLPACLCWNSCSISHFFIPLLLYSCKWQRPVQTPLTVTPSHLSFPSFSNPGCPINKHDHIVSLSCLLSIPALPPTHTRIHTAKQYHKSRDGRRQGGRQTGRWGMQPHTHSNTF